MLAPCPRPRQLAAAVVVALLACGGSGDTGDNGGSSTPTDGGGTSDAEPPAQTMVACGFEDQCVGEEHVCCMKIVGIELQTRCEADLGACGGDSRLECDDASDCGGDPCCVLDVGGAGGNTIIAECKPECSLFEKELCQGPDSCASGYCCQDANDIFGECVAEASACEAS